MEGEEEELKERDGQQGVGLSVPLYLLQPLPVLQHVMQVAKLQCVCVCVCVCVSELLHDIIFSQCLSVCVCVCVYLKVVVFIPTGVQPNYSLILQHEVPLQIV